MRRLAPILTAACAAIVGAVAIVGNSGAQQPGPPTGTLEFVALDRESRFEFIDRPPRRRQSAGDQFLITERLRDSSNRRVGRTHAVFAATPGRPRAFQGSGTFVLGNGQVVVAGALDEQGRTDTLAIVGGSGAFTGAQGTLLITERRRSTTFLLTFAG
jgi:hypothetical protein